AIPKTLETISGLERVLKDGKLTTDQSKVVEGQLNDMHRILEGQIAVVNSWKGDFARVASISRGMRDLEFPYRQDELRRNVLSNNMVPDDMKPPPPDCSLDFNIPLRDQDTYPVLRANLYGSIQGKVSPTESNTLVF